jgi:DDE superfamily endonuclease
MRGSPAGSKGLAVPSGWMDSETFIKWPEHFQQNVHSSDKDKVLFILDNHGSHRTLDAINFARANGIVMLSIPPHTSHKIQPLDRTFFGPLKTQLLESW